LIGLVKKSFRAANRAHAAAQWHAHSLLIFAFIWVIAAIVATIFEHNSEIGLVFGGLAIITLLVLRVSKPIERSQQEIAALLPSEIAAVGFVVQCESLASSLSAIARLEPNKANIDEQLRLAEHLTEATCRLISALQGAQPGSSPERER
jgi:hypothetical protein